MRTREAFLVSLAAILLEVSYTRIFSFKLVYYFTYLVIGIALLGLGSGGVLVAVSQRLRRLSTERLIAGCCLAGGLAVTLGYAVTARTPLNLLALVLALGRGEGGVVVAETAKLVLVCLTLFVPFLAAGIALAAIFARDSAHIGKLYAADLLGAALGCALVIPAMSRITPPGCVLLAGAILALPALLLAGGSARVVAAMTVVTGLVFGVVVPGRLPDPVPDLIKGFHPPIFSRWSPVFRVDVVPAPNVVPPTHFLVHDATPGSVINQWDGDVASLTRYETNERSIPFRVLAPKPRVAIVGSAGGNEIMASLRFDAEHVTGIELNPVTVSLLTTHFADFTGHLATHPKVTLVHAEARSFLRASAQTFDLIWLVAPDSYAAMNAATSAAFVLSESYLYTREMADDVFAHLNAEGLLAAQFGELDFDDKPNRTLRYLGTVRQALAMRGVADFERHVLVASSPGFGRLGTATILVRATPFVDADIAHFRDAVARVPGSRVIHPATGGVSSAAADRAIGEVIRLDDAALRTWYGLHPFSVTPIDDDSPFFWSFVRFRDALLGWQGGTHVNVEEGVGERLLLIFLVTVVVFGAVFLLAPLVVLRDVWPQVPHKLRAGIYFAALGTGFMFLEVSLIQKLTLFLGYPTHSLTVTLFALLLATGLGSLHAGRTPHALGPALASRLVFLAVMLGFYALGLDALVAAAIGWSFALRVALAVVVLAPLGFCLGAFMPLGLARVAGLTTHAVEFVAWCWAVNGFCSVLSSVLATVLAIAMGFNRVMLIGLALYTVGVAVFLTIPRPARSA